MANIFKSFFTAREPKYNDYKLESGGYNEKQYNRDRLGYNLLLKPARLISAIAAVVGIGFLIPNNSEQPKPDVAAVPDNTSAKTPTAKDNEFLLSMATVVINEDFQLKNQQARVNRGLPPIAALTQDSQANIDKAMNELVARLNKLGLLKGSLSYGGPATGFTNDYLNPLTIDLRIEASRRASALEAAEQPRQNSPMPEIISNGVQIRTNYIAQLLGTVNTCTKNLKDDNLSAGRRENLIQSKQQALVNLYNEAKRINETGQIEARITPVNENMIFEWRRKGETQYSTITKGASKPFEIPR